jgi:tetratricopeptide (TPR) repeat protein
LTVVFTDVEGSTELRTRLGDAAADEILKAHERLVREHIQAFSGREIKFLGDGFMLAFHSARDAIACAVAIQRTMRDEVRRDPHGVRLRIGMTTGEVVEEGGTLRGATVHAAARVSAKARGGQVLIPESLVPEAEGIDGVSLVDRGLYWLKGFPERLRVFEVIWDVGASEPLGPVDRSSFIGRDAERAELRRCLDEALSGKGSMVLIEGEPGIGKTRLTQELSTEADARAMQVLVGHCSEAEGSLPYLPWVEILENALAGAKSTEAFREALGDGAAEVARIVPEIRRIVPDLPPAIELPPEQQQRYLFNSIRDLFRRAAENRPLLLVLDDLQWADEATVLLLRHVLGALSDVPMLILGTYREDMDAGTPFSRALVDLLRHPLVLRILLRQLVSDEVAAMLGSLAGRTPPSALVQLVHTETDGNPFFVEEVFTHLMEEGRLLDEEGQWRPDAELGETEVPRTVRLVLERRLDRLTETARRTLATAAVIGRFFEVEALLLASDTDEEAVVDALADGERSNLVRLEEPTLERFAFVHELIRQTLLAGLPTIRRQRIHLRAAAALEERFAGREAEHASDLAYHLSRGGARVDRAKLRSYLFLAGKQAMQGSAFDGALRHFDAALVLPWDEDPRGRAELLFERGLALRSLRRWEEAVGLWTEAVDALQALGDLETAGHVCCEAAIQLGWVGRWEEAVVMAGRGLGALEGVVNADRGRLLAYTGLMFATTGYQEAADTFIADAHGVAAELGDEAIRGSVLGYEVVVRWEYMRNDEVARIGEEAISALRRSGALWQLAETTGFLQMNQASLGRWDEVEPSLEENEALALRLGNAQAQFLNLWSRVLLDLCRRTDLEAFRLGGQSILALCQSAGLPYEGEAYILLSEADHLAGDWERAVRHAEDAVRREDEGGAVFVGHHRGQLLRMLAYMGDRDNALALFEDPAVDLPSPGKRSGRGPWSFLLAAVEALWELRERDRLAKLYPAVVEALRQGIILGEFTMQPVERFAGVAAAAGRQWEAAEDHFEKALARSAALSHRLARADILRAWGRALIERDASGDDRRAGELLQEARATYRVIGMPLHADLVDSLLRR